MRLLALDREYLDSLIDAQGLDGAWKGLLRKRIEGSPSRFAYLLGVPELQKYPTAAHNILSKLTIGEISVLYEYSLAYSNRAKRKDEGQYFTPDDVAQFLAKQSSSFPNDAVWVDPCSGVGNLSYWLVKQKADPESFLQKKLYLIDRDPLALFIARVLFTLEFQTTQKNLYRSLEKRFIHADFLEDRSLPKFDAAILNPPYVSNVLLDGFETSRTKNTYAYFLEKVGRLCKQGYISITPQTFTNAANFASLRRTIIQNHKSISVYCFDNVPDNIFSGVKFGSTNTNKANSTRAGVIVAQHSKEKIHRITPLLRWRSHERAEMLRMAHRFLSETKFTDQIFPKISRELQTLYRSVKFNKTLRELVSTQPTIHTLQIPTTPRYFISANKRPVSRSSFRILYFNSKEDLDKAYVLLNSSYMYWWWRVNDGGMTISERTLLDLPIPDIDINSARAFVKKLEVSELKSRVIKKNAGKSIENVKHPMELIEAITHFLFPHHAKDLSATHSNSHINVQPPQLKLSF